MAITVPNVVKVTGSGVTTVTTSGVTTTTGSTFVAWTTADDGVTINAPTDSKSNSYGTAKVTVSTGGGTSKQTVYVKENGTGGAGHTLTFTFGSGTYPTCFFAEAAGAAVASYDSGSLTSGASGAGSPFARNSGGQAQAANAIFTFVATDAGGTLAYTNSGYTVTEEPDANNYWTGAIGRQIVNTTSAVASSWVVSPGASNGGTVTFAIKEAAGGGATTTTATAAAGVATVSGVGSSTAEASGTAAGSATASAVGSSAAVATASAAAGVSTVSAVGRSQAVTTATPAAGTSVVSGVGSSLTSGTTTAVPAAGAATVSASASSVSVTAAVPAAGTSSVSATSPDGVAEEPQESYSAPTKKRKYNYDYSSPKAEVVEPAKAPVKAVTKKAKKSVPPDMVEMLSLIEASQSVTAEVLSEQMAMRAAEQQQFEEEQEMMAVIACCL